MTPGYAKPRSELPWLPYWTQDKVFVINSHNFGGAFSPAVNGKMPIEVWCPSRDDAGNGTTTLNGLVSGKNGTLTNMDPATDWVPDTGAGGVRALSGDGTNNSVNTTFNHTGLSAFSYFAWAKSGSPSTRNVLISSTTATRIQTRNSLWLYYLANTSSFQYMGAVTGGWQHVGIVWNGTTFRPYLDGIAGTAQTPTSSISTFSDWIFLGNVSGEGFWSGLIDDVRVWDVALEPTDASDLYAAQRGGQA